jgi:hypothetical protein
MQKLQHHLYPSAKEDAPAMPKEKGLHRSMALSNAAFGFYTKEPLFFPSPSERLEARDAERGDGLESEDQKPSQLGMFLPSTPQSGSLLGAHFTERQGHQKS